MNALRDKARFKYLLSELFESFTAIPGGPDRPEFIGGGIREPLEHTTRRYVIDTMLRGLGWDLSQLTSEMVEEARAQGETTLFIDYLGVTPELGIPKLILEAKAWGKPFISHSDRGLADLEQSISSNPSDLVAAAIEHCKNGGSPSNSPASSEWAGWLQKLRDYVATVRQRSGHDVERVAITSGKWVVIIPNPGETFLGLGAVSPAEIVVFAQDSDIIHQSDEIYDFLSKPSLINDPPKFVSPLQLPSFVRRDDAKRLFRALWVVRRKDGAHFSPIPQFSLYPAAVIERSDGQLISVLDDRSERILVPHSYEDLKDHVHEMEARSNALLSSIHQEAEIDVKPSGMEVFPGFPSVPRFGVANSVTATVDYVKSWREPNEFLLVTGAKSHYVLPAPTIPACIGHSWADCYSTGEQQGDSPVMSRSFDPASFFTTLEAHHCAHRRVHGRREARCHISVFEDFLCCRACVFESLCWTQNELSKLPCGSTKPDTPRLRNGGGASNAAL